MHFSPFPPIAAFALGYVIQRAWGHLTPLIKFSVVVMIVLFLAMCVNIFRNRGKLTATAEYLLLGCASTGLFMCGLAWT